MAQYTESWTALSNGFSVYEAWAAGGGSLNAGGHAYYAAPGGGQYARKKNVARTNGHAYGVQRGVGGAGGAAQNGGDTSMEDTGAINVCLAKGGTAPGGTVPSAKGVGSTAGGVGDVVYFGGDGGVGDAVNDGGAGGGGSAGRSGVGLDGGAAGVVAGLGGVNGDGGPDGNGRDGTNSTAAGVGTEPGGGAGATSNFFGGAAGADGAWAVWDANDWDDVLEQPKPGAVPLGSGGVYRPAPAPVPGARRNQGFIM